MTEFAPTMPSIYYQKADHGRVHFVQAHNIDNSTRPVFQAWAGNVKDILVLDCGTWELGTPAITKLIDEAEQIHPDVLVCPDSFQEAEKTISLANNFEDGLRDYATQLMFIPQGRTVRQWRECLLQMVPLMRDGDWIGVPKVLNTYRCRRAGALGIIEEMELQYRFNIHLLGCWNGFDEFLFECSYFKWIRSVDTTLPYAFALQGINMFSDMAGKASLEHDDWSVGEVDEEVLCLVKTNILLCRKLLEQSVQDAR